MGVMGNLDALGLSPEQSLANINRLIDQQAFMLASNDIFGGSALIFMLLIPTIWFAERLRPPVAAAQAAKAPAPAAADAAAGAH
jgi:DHA2 family multidrug resistance protein